MPASSFNNGNDKSSTRRDQTGTLLCQKTIKNKNLRHSGTAVYVSCKFSLLSYNMYCLGYMWGQLYFFSVSAVSCNSGFVCSFFNTDCILHVKVSLDFLVQFHIEQHILLWMDCGKWNKYLKSKYNNLHVDSQHYQRVKSPLTRINMESLNKADIEFILPKEEETTACNLTQICQTVTSLQSLNKNNKWRTGGSVCRPYLNQQKDTKNRANRTGICFLLFQKEVQLWHKALITVESWKG